jgi:hypothetical protein
MLICQNKPFVLRTLAAVLATTACANMSRRRLSDNEVQKIASAAVAKLYPNMVLSRYDRSLYDAVRVQFGPRDEPGVVIVAEPVDVVIDKESGEVLMIRPYPLPRCTTGARAR